MTDIIARAQEIATNGHTPGPWHLEADELDPDWIKVMGPVQLQGNLITQSTVMNETDADYPDLHVTAFAPDAVAALAEETWEYGVQSRELDPIDGWFPWTFTIPFHKGRTMESCQRFIEGRSGHNFEYRIVRRRVSPVEVVG